MKRNQTIRLEAFFLYEMQSQHRPLSEEEELFVLLVSERQSTHEGYGWLVV